MLMFVFIRNEHLRSFPVRVAHHFSFLCYPIVCHYILIPCCNVRYDFCIKKNMFGSFLPPVVCRRDLIYVICRVQHILCCIFVVVWFVYDLYLV